MPHHWIITETLRMERCCYRSDDHRRNYSEALRFAMMSIAEEARLDSRAKDKEFLSIYRDALEKFKDAFDREQLPSITEPIRVANAEGGTFWKHAARQYERGNLFGISDTEIRSFVL